jgi:hypothetical protein
MAQKTIVELIDDLDGGEATRTLTFGINGAMYEIDLNDKNAEALEKALEKFVAAARKTGPGPVRPKPTYAKTDVVLTAVRAWAASNGIDVAARGRVAADVIEKFRAAGN